MPRVSVVIPAYNSAPYVEATMRSALAQTYDDLEIVVADHSSSDGTQEVLEQFRDEPRVRLLDPTPKGGGAKANWNRVSQAATGEFLKLLCADDIAKPTLVAEQVAAFDAHPTASLVACPRDMIDTEGKVLIRGRGLPGVSGLVLSTDAIRETVVRGANIFGEPGSVMMRRELFDAVGGWDDTDPYLIDERTYTHVMLEGLLRGMPHMVAVATPLAQARISASTWSVRLTDQQAAQAISFHEWVHATHPEIVSRTDLLRGNLMARVSAYGRRAVYAGLGRRMGRDKITASEPNDKVQP